MPQTKQEKAIWVKRALNGKTINIKRSPRNRDFLIISGDGNEPIKVMDMKEAKKIAFAKVDVQNKRWSKVKQMKIDAKGGNKVGDKVLANFTGQLEEAKIFGVQKIGDQQVYHIQSIKNPKQKITSLRRDFKDVRTGM